jgi:rod shape-determining protein MreC
MRISWSVLWRRDFPVFLVLVVVSIAIMAAGQIAGVNPVSRVLGYAFIPFEALSYRLMNVAYNSAENHVLRARLAELSQDNMTLREQVHEIDRLRRLLEFRDVYPAPLKPCRVVAEIDKRLGGGIIIDRGYDAGLVRNMTVISPEGLVGLIVRSGENMSTVKRIVDPGSRVSACLQYSRVAGILNARSDGRLFMEWVAPDAEVEPGDTVVSSGLGSVVPKGILIGKVHHIYEDPEKFSLSLEVGSFVDFDRLEEVFVLMAGPAESMASPEATGSAEVSR